MVDARKEAENAKKTKRERAEEVRNKRKTSIKVAKKSPKWRWKERVQTKQHHI